jgi:hypothetical protein
MRIPGNTMSFCHVNTPPIIRSWHTKLRLSFRCSRQMKDGRDRFW